MLRGLRGTAARKRGNRNLIGTAIYCLRLLLLLLLHVLLLLLLLLLLLFFLQTRW